MKARIAPLALTLALVACATTPPVRYYTLGQDLAPPASAAGAHAPRLRLAIAPVSLPESLDRPNIVLHSAPTRVQILEQDRWANGLQQEIARVVAERLNARLPTFDVSYYPQAAAERPDYGLSLDVQHFDAQRGGTVTVMLRWSLLDAHGTRLQGGELQAQEKTQGDGVDAVVEADARALRHVADSLAEALSALRLAPAAAGT